MKSIFGNILYTVLDYSGSFLLAAALQQFRPVILTLPITASLFHEDRR